MADVTLRQRPTYGGDFHAWLNEQAALLRAGQVGLADHENLAEEVEDLGSNKRSELDRRMAVLLLHLLKWQHQPSRRGASWERTIREQRRALARLGRRNPSLRRLADGTVQDMYKDAVLRAASETGLAEDVFPLACPFGLAAVMDESFWPEPVE